MGNLQYGNWIRRKVLWLLGLTSLALGVVAALPIPVFIRVLSGILGLVALISFLYPLYAYFMFSHWGGNLPDKFYELILGHIGKNSAGKLLDIEVLDHLVIGNQRFVSLKERGLAFS